MNWNKTDTGQDEIHCWVLAEDVETGFSFEEPEVDLISESSDELGQFDLPAIEKVLASLDIYFDKGIRYLQAELRKNPAPFKLTDKQLEYAKEYETVNQYYKVPDNAVEKYSEVATAEFPVNQPNIVFYPDGTWLMRFAESSFPSTNYGHGIAVYFDTNNEITGFDILDEQ